MDVNTPIMNLGLVAGSLVGIIYSLYISWNLFPPIFPWPSKENKPGNIDLHVIALCFKPFMTVAVGTVLGLAGAGMGIAACLPLELFMRHGPFNTRYKSFSLEDSQHPYYHWSHSTHS